MLKGRHPEQKRKIQTRTSPACRFHNLRNGAGNGINCGRSMDLANVAGLGDFIATSSLSDNNVMSLTNATQFDSGIHVCALKNEQQYAQNPQQTVQVKLSFVVSFMGQTQSMAASTAELGA